MSDLDTLRGLGDQIVPPPFDDLRETARRRDRRTTAAAALSTVAVIAAVAWASVLISSDEERSQDPVQQPDVVDTTRPLTYAEGTTVHYGDQSLTAPTAVAELDLTDAGIVVRTEDGRIWFADGSEFEQIGTLGQPSATQQRSDYPYGATWGYVVSGNTGSRVAWFEFPQPGRPSLVVFDTRTGAEVVRQALDVEPGSYALLASVTDRYGYWYDDPETVEDLAPLPLHRILLSTGEQSNVTPEVYAADSPSAGTPRTMMLSNAEGGGPPFQVADGIGWQFSVGGGRVEPQGSQPLDARDGATSKRFVFDAPAGYPRTLITWLTQWLDDERVLLVTEPQRDLLECSLATRACVVALTLPKRAVLPDVG
ncbi:hypothetical protein NOCA2220156 [metagenome]|uniref:Uncharacterized protein n=1 Tax=metagenome TaxID=256318 RepID=A0A2P2BYZ3_9ZZZZ